MRVPRFHILFDVEGGGAATTATAAPPSQGGNSEAGTPPAAPAASPAPAGSPASGTPAPSSPGGTPPSPAAAEPDRSTWLSPERVNQIIQDRVNRVAADRDRYRAMLEAGTGVRPGQYDPPDPQLVQAREALEQIAPGLSKVLEFYTQNEQQLAALLQAAPDLASSVETQWTAHGDRMLAELHGAIGKVYGAEKLDSFQEQAVNQTYLQWLKSDPKLAQRYARGDQKLAGEFVSLWSRGFVDPVRRAGAAGVAATANRNQGLPSAPQQSGLAPGAAPQQPKTEDEVMDAGWQAVLAANQARQAV